MKKFQKILSATTIIILGTLPYALAKTAKTKKPSAPSKVELAAAPAPKEIVIKGRIFERGSDKKKQIFSYERRFLTEANTTNAQARYFDLEGKVVYEEKYLIKDKKIVSYSYDQKQVGDQASAEINGDKISMRFTEDGKTKTKEVEDKGLLILPLVISGIIADNWDLINRGDTLETRYVLVERLDTVGFSFKKKGELTYEGKEAIKVQMKPTSFIIASIVDPITMIFEKNGEHRLLESDGRTPIRVPKYGETKKRSDWKALDAVLALDY